MGSCTRAGTDLAVAVSLDFSAGIVLASALAGSDLSFGGSDGSWFEDRLFSLPNVHYFIKQMIKYGT